jgi:hypothetical protein
MKTFSITNYVILFIILITLGILYKKFEDKRIREENNNNNNAIQKYLLDDTTLAKSKKPILWLHVPYEYNARHWLSFGSRSSLNLNQPYLYLTVKSIITQCEQSFTICIIDDSSFKKLIPSWNIDMSTISSPILNNMRNLGLMKLLYIYGGLLCPISFLCIKDLIGLYNEGISGDKMFLCETINRNVTSTEYKYYPNISFCGSLKENNTLQQLINFMQRIISTDFTSDSNFKGDFNRWCEKRIKHREINFIDGMQIGIKNIDDEPILVDDLMSNNYLNLYRELYGILIPADELVNRRKYEWFVRMSERQVLESNTIIGNYILVVLGQGGGNILEPLTPSINKEIKNDFVGFWRTPDYPGLYGLKPNFLGDNLLKQQYTGR